MTSDEAVPWLRLLAPSADRKKLAPASGNAHLAHATTAIGADAVRWAVEVGLDVAERVAAEIPGHIGEGGLDVLRTGTESTILQLLMMLAEPDGATPATSESLSGIADFVRRRVSLEEMLRGIALGHAVIAAAVLTECGRLGDPSNRHEQMRALSQRMFVFFDAFSSQMSATYREEEIRWEQSESVSRLALVDALLRRQEVPLDVSSRRLRYDLARTHIALIIWSDARAVDSDEKGLLDAARALIRTAGCEQKLIVSGGPGVVWAWVVPTWNSDGACIERLAALRLPAGVHAVAGPPVPGMTGFRTSHEDAAAAFALRSSSPRAHGITVYRDVDLLSLLLADRPRAIRFARSELGELSGADPASEEMRRTLLAYLHAGGSPNVAAQELQVSRNTVTYRVRRAEDLLGRSVGERRQHLMAALAILQECSG